MIIAFLGSKDTTAKDVMDFPDPLSPTRDNVFPLLRLKLELCKTFLFFVFSLKLIDKFFIDKTLSII